VKQSEFRRWLAERGCTFQEGGNHTKIYLNGRQTVMPSYPSKEMKLGTMLGIRKRLGLK
jgi:mRNA interferase HicA